MIGPRPREQWKDFRSKQELIEALRARFREEFPTTRFNFTQPIIISMRLGGNGSVPSSLRPACTMANLMSGNSRAISRNRRP